MGVDCEIVFAQSEAAKRLQQLDVISRFNISFSTNSRPDSISQHKNKPFYIICILSLKRYKISYK